MTGSRRGPQSQGDLFGGPDLFPVRRPTEGRQPVDLGLRSLRMKGLMSEALDAYPESREIVAAKIVEMTGRPLTKFALDKYTQPSAEDHDIGLIRFVALVRVTGAFWLWDELVADDGLVVLQGREAKLAELGHLHQEHQRLGNQLKTLKRELDAAPVDVAPRRQPRAKR